MQNQNPLPQKAKRHRRHKKKKNAQNIGEAKETKQLGKPEEEEDFDDYQEMIDEDSEPEFDPDSEDQGIEDYKISGYHPVHIGEVIYNRYVILQKLGWGRFSTVWLAKDFKYDNYVALKIQKSAPHYLQAAYDQVQILQRAQKKMSDPEWIKSLKEYYPEKTTFSRDQSHVITLLNSFLYKGPYGNHFCFVLDIMGVNLYEIIKRYNFKGTPLHLVRKIAQQILVGLDFLHRICHVIHTDLKPENVVVSLTESEIKEIIDNGRISESKAYQARIKEYQEAHGVQLQEHKKKEEEGKREKERIAEVAPTKEVAENHEEEILTIKQKIQELEKNLEEKKGEMNKSKKANMRKLIKKYKNKLESLLNPNSKPKQESGDQEQEEKVKPKENASGGLPLINFDKPDQPHYDNKDLRGPKLDENVKVKIADLGNACWVHHHFSSQIQTRQYRSPETLIGVKYDTSADIWSFACMIYQMLTGELLFEPTKQRDFTKNQHHLALIQQRVGKFPYSFKVSGKKSKHYFGKDDKLTHFKDIPYVSISSVLTSKFRIRPSEAQAFEKFLLPMLNPCPHLRISAREALKSEWLAKPKCSYKMDLQQHFDYMSRLRGNIIRQNGNMILFSENPSDNEQAFDAGQGQSIKDEKPEEDQGRTRINIKLIDQSFSDLGYIGYSQGLKLEQLDSIPNWQFV